VSKVFYFGVDYYPEHWPEERWAEDARLMQEAGMNVVRLAEFAWSKMEPREGQFDFDWLDRAIGVLAEKGIKIVLGTPTASPPPWIMTNPELFTVNEDGVRSTYGLRREYCPTNETYRCHSVRITEAMADHYKNNPHVIGWQIDNEFGNRCYCPLCQKAFQAWLQKKYGTLDELNRRWGTIFWSHVYTEWSQIPAAAKTAFAHNPGLDLDYRRFMSDTYYDYQQLQIDAIRERCPNHFITHNLMGFKYPNLDYFDMTQSLDFVAWDNYPRGFWDLAVKTNPPLLALGHDAMRSLKHKNFWVMEAQGGPAGWEIIGVTPVRAGSPVGVSGHRAWSRRHGVLPLAHLPFRDGRILAWHLDHDARPRRRYAEVKQMERNQTTRRNLMVLGAL
jgi:beta-galactosidase